MKSGSLLIANVVMPWQTHSPQFAEIWIASLVLTLLIAYQLAYRRQTTPKCSAPASRPVAVAPRGRSLPPEDRPPLLRAVGQLRWIEWASAFESMSVGSPVVEHKTDGEPPDGL